MLLKIGVDISRLHKTIRTKLNIIDNIFYRNTGKEAVITSTYEGSHSPGSLHYQNKAVDLRTKGLMAHIKQDILTELKMHLGGDYDIILESTHLHCEFDISD